MSGCRSDRATGIYVGSESFDTMPECDRCGMLTDSSQGGGYHCCENCRRAFSRVRESGVVVRGGGECDVLVNVDGEFERSARGVTQTDALARGKLIADELGTDALFEYERSGSTWVLDEFLSDRPDVQAAVSERLSRVPERDEAGLGEKLRAIV